MIRRTTFEALGRFDEEFPFACMEDCDLMARLTARRAAVVWAEDAAVRHPWRSLSEREVSRQIISHAIYAQKHPEFARSFDLRHLARAMRGRLRQYLAPGTARIPAAKYRSVGFDFVAPLAVYAVTHVAPLRRLLWSRYRNRLPGTAG